MLSQILAIAIFVAMFIAIIVSPVHRFIPAIIGGMMVNYQVIPILVTFMLLSGYWPSPPAATPVSDAFSPEVLPRGFCKILTNQSCW